MSLQVLQQVLPTGAPTQWSVTGQALVDALSNMLYSCYMGLSDFKISVGCIIDAGFSLFGCQRNYLRADFHRRSPLIH